jgi:hypothetical protein
MTINNKKNYSVLLQSVFDVLDQLTKKEIEILSSRCTEKHIEMERTKLAKKDADAENKPKNQYKNNYYRK